MKKNEVQPMQYSKGPWKHESPLQAASFDAEPYPDLHVSSCEIIDEESLICKVVVRCNEGMQEANAALIAASPELREKLANLVEWVAGAIGDERLIDEWRDAKALLTRLRNAGA